MEVMVKFYLLPTNSNLWNGLSSQGKWTTIYDMTYQITIQVMFTLLLCSTSNLLLYHGGGNHETKLGIGMASPDYPLHVSTTITWKCRIGTNPQSLFKLAVTGSTLLNGDLSVNNGNLIANGDVTLSNLSSVFYTQLHHMKCW